MDVDIEEHIKNLIKEDIVKIEKKIKFEKRTFAITIIKMSRTKQHIKIIQNIKNRVQKHIKNLNNLKKSLLIELSKKSSSPQGECFECKKELSFKKVTFCRECVDKIAKREGGYFVTINEIIDKLEIAKKHNKSAGVANFAKALLGYLNTYKDKKQV